MADDVQAPAKGVPTRKVGRAVLPAGKVKKPSHTRRVGHAVLPPGHQPSAAHKAEVGRKPGRAVLPSH